MIKTTIVGGNVVVKATEELTEDVAEAVRQGVVEATNDLRKDVEGHTPVGATGKARSAAVAFIRAGSGIVQYDYRASEAFYMRFVLGGALPHRIRPRYSTERGLRQAIRRRENQGLSTDDVNPKKSLYFTVGGRDVFAKEVRHPGIGARKILTRRLTANEAEILATIRTWIEKALYLRGLEAEGKK